MIVKNEKSNLFHHDGRTLMPGTNTVSVDWWKKARKHPSVKRRLEMGTLVEETDLEEAAMAEALGETPDEVALQHIKSLNVSNAKNLVSDTVDVALLKGWLEVEGRKGVKDAITAQLAKLEAPAEMRDRSAPRGVVTGKGPEVVHVTASPGAQDD
jgi:hypothetical protein